MSVSRSERARDIRILFATCSPEQADALARMMVEERLVACVNAIPGVVSHYHWEGRIERDEEIVLLMETTAEAVPRAVARLETLHDYDVPKIVVLDPEDVSPAYAEWLRVSVAKR
jgi:periplasmic divalent cation tolerance protein